MRHMNDEETLIEGKDFDLNENGDRVFTGAYLLKRGQCCQSGCEKCPYDYHAKVDPNVPAEFQSPWDDMTKVEEIQKYLDELEND